jgi:hypothetical protein
MPGKKLAGRPHDLLPAGAAERQSHHRKARLPNTVSTGTWVTLGSLTGQVVRNLRLSMSLATCKTPESKAN